MEPLALFDRYLQLRQYIGWSDYDVQRVRGVGPLVTPFLPRIVDDFYNEIERHQETRIVITGGKNQIKRLKSTLLAWLQDLFSGYYDREYVSRRWRVGWRHVEIGLDRIFVSAAFARLRAQLTSALQEAWEGAAQDLVAAVQSLNSLLDLDLAIIEYAYQTASLHREQTAVALANRKGEDIGGCSRTENRSFISEVGLMAIPHAKPGDVIDVRPLGEKLAESQTTTLFKTRSIEVVRIVMAAGKRISEHEAPGEIIVQCLEGRIAFTAQDKIKELQGGQLLYLAAEQPHSVECIEDASFLLTIVLPR
jgi:quercetin dioxygenase-like cupin family protein